MSQGNEIAERIAEIQRTIVLSGGYPQSTIQLAEAYQPSDVNSASLPFFINEVSGMGTNFLATGGLQFVETVFRMHLCVQRSEANTNLRDSLKMAMQWRDVVFIAFAKHLRLSDVSGNQDLNFILDARITTWDLESYSYGTSEYVALRFYLTVREAFPLTIEP